MSGKGKGGGKGGKGKGKGGRRETPDQAFRRFLATQQEGLRAWAKQRTSQIEEIGMSVEMEVLVCDLLEELREEPGALDLTESAAAQAALLQRACVELRFVERHAQQAVAIVLGRSSVNAPNVLAECLDWLCVHVPVDELPLQFRPKLRPRPARRPAAGARRRRGARCGVVGSEANSAASLGAPLDDDDDWDDGRRSRGIASGARWRTPPTPSLRGV